MYRASADYINGLLKIRSLIEGYQKDGVCKATTEELNHIVNNLDPADFAAYGREICVLYSSKIGVTKGLETKPAKKCGVDRVIFVDRKDGTSKYYPTFPEFLPRVLYPNSKL